MLKIARQGRVVRLSEVFFGADSPMTSVICAVGQVEWLSEFRVGHKNQ